MNPPVAIDVAGLAHRYGERRALAGVSLQVAAGEVFGLLGPNGGGKTTLFRILSTLLPVQEGEARIMGFDLRTRPADVRRAIGVTFQSPSLDPKLTVRENLVHQGRLYGLWGRRLNVKCDELIARLRVADRSADRVETLSGGLKRRVEVAKGLLHDPQVLLLDEPSAGLDPGARHDLWQHLSDLRDSAGVTILVTTHLMDEAERCGRLGILSRGDLVAVGTPAELRDSVGHDSLTIATAEPERLSARLLERFGVSARRVGNQLRIDAEAGPQLVLDIAREFRDDIDAVTLGRPTLEDVFLARTGHRFGDEDEPPPAPRRRR